MRQPSSLLPALLAALVLSGCSLTPSRDGEILAPVTRAGTEYEQARKRYSNDPAIIELYRDRLVELSLTLAQHRRQEGEWYAAERTLQQALDYLPEQPRLEQALNKTTEQRQTRMQQVRDQALADEAAYLLARQDQLREQTRLQSPDYLDAWQRSRVDRQLEALADPLRNCARRNLERDALEQAKRCLELATRIRDPAFVQATRQALQARLAPPQQTQTEPAPAAETTNTSRNAERRQQESELRARLTQAMNAGDLSQARSITRKLIALKGQTPRLRDLQRSLDTAIQVQIDSLHKLANEHYRSQRYQEAKAAWEEVLKLNPDDPQARTLLERAERVIQKLESLHREEDDSSATP